MNFLAWALIRFLFFPDLTVAIEVSRVKTNQASNKNNRVHLTDNGFHVGQSHGNGIRRSYVTVAQGGQGRKAKIEQDEIINPITL